MRVHFSPENLLRPIQKYSILLLVTALQLSSVTAMGQCLMLPNAFETRLLEAEAIVEGKVGLQECFFGSDGNIYTRNTIETYRVLKGSVGNTIEIVTEGGVVGDLMQVVTPSVQVCTGQYGIFVLSADVNRVNSLFASAFYPIHERSSTVEMASGITDREVFYEAIGNIIGTHRIELRRLSEDFVNGWHPSASRSEPQISDIYPLEVTAGTQTVLTISGSGFGAEQGNGKVLFRNADDGGQSFVGLPEGPHYLSWTDTEIMIYVPSATLYNSTVAGTGDIRVTTDNGLSVQSTQQVTIDYAKSEVIYSNGLSRTMLVGMNDGGYRFTLNADMMSRAGGSGLVEDALMHWMCNTGVNYSLSETVSNETAWAYDGVNLLGMSAPGQIPPYQLGRTITTFSGCGTGDGIQWNLVEIDVLFNPAINWWTSLAQPIAGSFDLSTSIIHELGHGHLLQHNNIENSPMYFQLLAGQQRRVLLPHSSISGGNLLVEASVLNTHTCGEVAHVQGDNSECDYSLINGVDEDRSEGESVYPNPFDDAINLVVKGSGTYRLVDVAGKMVYEGVLTGTLHTVETSALPSGLYFIQMQTDEGESSFKLIKN